MPAKRQRDVPDRLSEGHTSYINRALLLYLDPKLDAEREAVLARITTYHRQAMANMRTDMPRAGAVYQKVDCEREKQAGVARELKISRQSVRESLTRARSYVRHYVEEQLDTTGNGP